MISIIAVTEDWMLTARLAKVCSDFGCQLILPRIDEFLAVYRSNGSGIFLLDLTTNPDQMIKMAKGIQNPGQAMILGVTGNHIKTIRNQAIDHGFQMVFTKRGFIRNLGLVIRQRIRNDPGN